MGVEKALRRARVALVRWVRGGSRYRLGQASTSDRLAGWWKGLDG